MIDQAKKDPVGYDAFYRDYSLFLKEGIVTSQSPVERVSVIMSASTYLMPEYEYTYIFIIQ